MLVVERAKRIGKTCMTALLCLLFLTGQGVADGTDLGATAAEERTFAAFEGYCLAYMNKPTELAKLFAASGVKYSTGPAAQALLAGHPGKVWLLHEEGASIVVAQTDMGVCSVVNADRKIRGESVRRVFESHSRNRLLNTERVGSQNERMYAVTLADLSGGRDIHALVSIPTSNLSSMGGIILSAIPESALVKENVTIPKWP